MLNTLKKNWYYLLAAALILLPVTMTLWISVAYDYPLKESWTAFQTYNKADTNFQRLKFSESAFSKITPGMSGADVYALVGLPLERHDDDTVWHYSVPVRGAQYYHERTLLMQPGTGKVAKIIKRYHTPESAD